MNKCGKLDKAYNEEQIKINKNKLLDLSQTRLRLREQKNNDQIFVASQTINLEIEQSKSLKKPITQDNNIQSDRQYQ